MTTTVHPEGEGVHDEPLAAVPRDNPMTELGDLPVTRVLLVDDHRAFSESLAVAIGRHPDLACVGTPTTIGDCVAIIEEAAPDVVLLDIHLPDGDGIEAIADIRRRRSTARIVVMTGSTDVDVMSRAAAAGAAGFLRKESPVKAVITAIRAARDGEMLVDGSTLAAILGRVPTVGGGPGTGSARLTSRELEVLGLMGSGLDAHAIAKGLGISIHTCRGYQKSILAKLDAHSQLEAVVRAARQGLIAPLGR